MSKVQTRADYPVQKPVNEKDMFVTRKPIRIKAKAQETVNTTGRVVRNAEHFVQAVALLVLAGFAYVQVKEVTNDVLYFAVLASLIVVGLRGAVEFVSFLNKD